MSIYFIQIPAGGDLQQKVAAASKPMQLWDIMQSGGALMIPLGLLLILAVFFFFERYIAIKKAGKIDDNFMRIIRDHILKDNELAARAMTKNTDNPVARISKIRLKSLEDP